MFNPVDWHPWGDEALSRARAEDRPLLVSIGYSACHWCHVMERESFEDDATAALMNRLFVNVKVDREERPDVDQIYMETAVRLTGSGGWPLTVFCTPDGRPFWAGTYFPPQPAHGRPSFQQVLEAVADAWRSRRDDVEKSAEQILAALRSRPTGPATPLPGTRNARGRCRAHPRQRRSRSRRLRRRAEVSDADEPRRAARGVRSPACLRKRTPPSPTSYTRAASTRGGVSSTSSAADSIVTASTSGSRSRTSRRCSTTRASSCGASPRHGADLAKTTTTCDGPFVRRRTTCGAR